MRQDNRRHQSGRVLLTRWMRNPQLLKRSWMWSSSQTSDILSQARPMGKSMSSSTSQMGRSKRNGAWSIHLAGITRLSLQSVRLSTDLNSFSPSLMIAALKFGRSTLSSTSIRSNSLAIWTTSESSKARGRLWWAHLATFKFRPCICRWKTTLPLRPLCSKSKQRVPLLTTLLRAIRSFQYVFVTITRHFSKIWKMSRRKRHYTHHHQHR